MGISRLVLIGALLAPGMGISQQIPMRPFTLDHAARVDSPVDLTFLLDGPAGKDGFIRVQNGHLVKPDGKRFRIWGVCVTGWTRGSSLLPPKEDAPIWAATLARYGVNCVRMHFLDRTTVQVPRGLIDGSRKDSRHMDPEQLDRLDFFVAELKKRGIYTDLNLNVGRDYKPEDGVPDYELIGVAKAMTYVGEQLLALQKEYATQLLTHYNPYTKSEYAKEPAVAIVELVNENSVLEFWYRNWLKGNLKRNAARYQLDFTPTYEKILSERYNRWLTEKLSAAQLRLVRQQAGVKGNEPVPRLRREEFAEAGKERFHAETAFYTDVESGFFLDMKNFLREKLGVKSLIVATADHTYWIPGLPLLRSTSKLDIVDGHVYWQHPSIWGKRNTPMVNDPLGSTVVKLTRSVLSGRPFTCSEVNHPNPNEYSSEMIPILASYGAFQDWDGITFYTFEPKVTGQGQPYVQDAFDITLDPVKMTQMSAGALIFERGDVHAAKQIIERTYSAEQIDESGRLPESGHPYFTPGFPLEIPLMHGSRIRCLDCEPTPKFAAPKIGTAIVSDTNELAWYTDAEKGGLVTIDTDRTQGLVGFVKVNGRRTRHLSADTRNDFCAITVQSLDSKPLARSTRMLLIAASRMLNTGAKWNERHTLLTEVGGPPTTIEPVTGWVMLRDLEGPVGMLVRPLDGSARPIGQPIQGRRLEEGWEFPVGDPPTTWYLIDVIR